MFPYIPERSNAEQPPGTPRAREWVMSEELAFLKYRREVVAEWPESYRRTVFLAAIDSRIARAELEEELVAYAAQTHSD
jgi:hypothetical protein